MSRAMLRRLAGGDAKPGPSTLAGLATSLGVSMSRLLQGLGGHDAPAQVVGPSEGLRVVRRSATRRPARHLLAATWF
jgi:hypothetical protein